MKRLIVTLLALLAIAAPASASKTTSWHRPPPADTWTSLHDIYGSNHDGYMVGNVTITVLR